MELRKISDIHLESNRGFRPKEMEGESAQVLILAGDICEFQKTTILDPFIEEMSHRFKKTIYVPGNHEYYGGHIPNSLNKARERYSKFSNVHILDDEYIDIDDVRFIGATLWTDMNRNNPLAMFEAGQYMNDYKKIRVSNYRKIKPIETVGMHAKSIMFIKNSLENSTFKNVVVTHHAPSWLSIDERYRGDSLNPAYVSDQSELIYQHSPELWFHGHVHSTFDYMLYDTRVICNPKGYSSHSMGAENPAFDCARIIRI